MIRNRSFNIGNLIRLGSGGLEVAEFVDIRDAIITRYKEVYGSDIDVSTASADGVFVNDLSIIVNNILQVCKMLYANLNVETANGVYLDALCKLANITRQEATRSTVSLVVTSQFTSGSNVTFGDPDVNDNVQNRITFVDKAGTEWIAPVSVTLGPGESVEVTAECSEAGPVSAPAGWIDRTAITMNLSVSQPNAAIEGETEESDQELRKRRAQSSGADGVAVLESLSGALLEVTGINDVKIYNNNTLSNQNAKDGTQIVPHNVYVILRQQEGLQIDDSTIGDMLYEKLTPGIRTTESADATNGEKKSYEYVPEMLGVTVSMFNQMVYWKKAKPIAPLITAKITPTTYFVESEFTTLAQAVFDYANNIKLGDDISTDQIFIEILQADPEFRGQRTYSLSASGVTIANSSNPDTYYNYTNFSYQKEGDGTYTFTIS